MGCFTHDCLENNVFVFFIWGVILSGLWSQIQCYGDISAGLQNVIWELNTDNTPLQIEISNTVIPILMHLYFFLQVIDKGYFSEAFLFKPQGGQSPPSGLNRKLRKNPLFSL